MKNKISNKIFERRMACFLLFFLLLTTFTGCSAFNKMFQQMPVTVSFEKTSGNGTVAVYNIIATVKNASQEKLNIIQSKISLQNGGQLQSEEIQLINGLGSGESSSLTWVVQFDTTNQNSEYSITIDTTADGIISKQVTETIKVRTMLIELATANKFKFTHSGSFSDSYKWLTVDRDYLYKNINKSDESSLWWHAGGSWAGSCFGLSSVAILANSGKITPDLYQKNAKSISEFNLPKNNIGVESLITYYQMAQFLTPWRSIKDIGDSAQLHEMERLLGSNSATPLLITFDFRTDIYKNWTFLPAGGHAVVGYGVEDVSASDPQSGKYDKKIKIYDVNAFGKSGNFDLYYKSDYSKWTIPFYSEDRGCFWLKLKKFSNSLDAIDPYNFNDFKKSNAPVEVPSILYAKNDIPMVSAKGFTGEITLENSSMQKVTVNGESVVGDLDNIWTYFDLTMIDNMEAPPVINIVLPSFNEINTIKNNIGGELDLYTVIENGAMSAKTSDCSAVVFDDKEDSVSISNNSSDFNVSMTFNDGFSPLPWHTVEVSGESKSDVKLEKSENGFMLLGDNLKNIKVAAVSDTETIDMKLKTDNNRVFIGTKGDKLAAYTDENNDGNFDHLIAAGKTANQKELFGDGDFEMPVWLIILLSSIGLALIILVIIIALVSGSKNKKNRDEDFEIHIKQAVMEQAGPEISSEAEPSALTPPEQQNIAHGISVLTGPMTGCKAVIADGETINLGKDQKLTHLVFTKEYGKVSRLHCTAAYSDKFKKYYVTDCSANGTYFTDGTRLTKGVRTPMQPGTILLLADDSCKVQLL